MRYHRILVFLLCFLTTGAVAAEQKGSEFAVGAFVFTTPPGWKIQAPSSPMRKAELQVIDKETLAVAETVFFDFGPGQGGTVEENITRWKGQVTDPVGQKVTEKEIAGTRVTLVKFSGTYLSGMPGGVKSPLAGSTLLGAILESSQGNVFVKLTGPAAWVEKMEKDFAAMIESGAKNKRG